MDQNRKPGAPPAKDISDLKARLGLKRPDAAPAPAAPMPGVPGGFPQAARAPIPGAPAAAPQYQQAPAAPAAPPAGLDPFAGMKPQAGHFDLRTIDDGVPAENVRSGRGKAAIVTSIVVGIAAFALGAGLGVGGVGRANFNTANHAAKTIKGEVETMQKTLNQIGTAVALSQQRQAAAHKDVLDYDPQLIAELEKVKLDPRPNTATIFRVDYFRLEDIVVDHLFNYYYDTIALYNEVDRHIKRTKADAESLKAYADKTAAAGQKNYGLVFDNSAKIVVGNLVEIGEQVCKGGGKDCGANDLVGFKVRANTGAPWVDRKSGAKLDDENVVPIKPTPLMDAVMTGSPDQVRAEAYKQRTANIRSLVSRITAVQKDLNEGVSKAAERPDLFTIF
ncbi:MAG TPA: hypothetical protein VHJ20_04900 [Polyangia bacterium]|nr:hypothetical protein [Polyangia bacterium]